jgi:hypothetical protein
MMALRDTPLVIDPSSVNLLLEISAQGSGEQRHVASAFLASREELKKAQWRLR